MWLLFGKLGTFGASRIKSQVRLRSTSKLNFALGKVKKKLKEF